MATIPKSSPDRVALIKKFYGLNENPDGTTKLRQGEAVICKNFRITKDGNLQRRPGHQLVCVLGNGNDPVVGMWHGYVNKTEYILAACQGKLYMVYNGTNDTYPASEIGSISTSNGAVHMFGFNENVYILDGSNYLCWNGTTLATVDGYVPLIANAIGPVGTADEAGVLLEQINKLTAKRRAWLSPDGTNKKFQLPEKDLQSIDKIIELSTGDEVPAANYQKDTANGTVEFNSVPTPAAANAYEVQYTSKANYRSQVTNMRFSEIFTDAKDSRVFLYGDGTNQVIYSDMDYDGNGRADYFSDLNVMNIGDENTPVTGLIRHFSRLICYKLNSTWSISSSTVTLADGSIIPSFHISAVNRSIGNEMVGNVQLVLNNPRTIFRGSVYEWRGSKSYGNLTNDERQAVRISDRIRSSLQDLCVIGEIVCYDDNFNQEYYICNSYTGVALVHNYAVDAWYVYENIYAWCFCNKDNGLFFAGDGGHVRVFDPELKSDVGSSVDPDDEVPIEALWVSGHMDFGADYMRKYSSTLWVSVKPESNSWIELSITTDRRKDFSERLIAQGSYGFPDWDFRTWTFDDNFSPRIFKVRLKAKKFVYYQLGLYSNEVHTTATVLGVDILNRQTGYAK